MKKIDLTELRKQQARILRARGMSLGKAANWIGLTKNVVAKECRDIIPPEDAPDLESRMKDGTACLYCGSDLPGQEGAGRRRRYCCETCRREYWKIHRSEARKKPQAIRIRACIFCGGTFEVYGTREQKYCSRHCFMLHRNGHRTHKMVAV